MPDLTHFAVKMPLGNPDI